VRVSPSFTATTRPSRRAWGCAASGCARRRRTRRPRAHAPQDARVTLFGRAPARRPVVEPGEKTERTEQDERIAYVEAAMGRNCIVELAGSAWRVRPPGCGDPGFGCEPASPRRGGRPPEALGVRTRLLALIDAVPATRARGLGAHGNPGPADSCVCLLFCRKQEAGYAGQLTAARMECVPVRVFHVERRDRCAPSCGGTCSVYPGDRFKG
jgi:hypothetical protein